VSFVFCCKHKSKNIFSFECLLHVLCYMQPLFFTSIAYSIEFESSIADLTVRQFVLPHTLQFTALIIKCTRTTDCMAGAVDSIQRHLTATLCKICDQTHLIRHSRTCNFCICNLQFAICTHSNIIAQVAVSNYKIYDQIDLKSIAL
jgi:hypothetical protein